MLRSLLIDFNSYFASVEQQLQPSLRGRPVAVLPVMADSTCCIAASYEAKALGIRTGTRVSDAKRLCPGIALVLARHPVYVDFHQRAVAVIDRIAPVRQVLSIDEMECELTGRWRQREQALQIAQRIKTALTREMGECLRSSIGIAPNTLLAKLASNMQKPDGLTVLEDSDIPGRFLHLPPSALNGIGPRMSERLQRCGITDMASLYAAPRDLLQTAWGGVAGREMYDLLRGAWRDTPAREPQSLGHSHVLPPQLRHPNGARDVLHRLLQKAAMRLRKMGHYATGLSARVRAIDGPGAGLEARFAETQDTAQLLHTLEGLWPHGLSAVRHPLSVGVVLHGLVPAQQHTPDLFEAVAPKAVPGRDRTRLHAAMDALNQRHGANTLHFASAHTARHEAPMRIAFNRIPDLDTEA